MNEQDPVWLGKAREHMRRHKTDEAFIDTYLQKRIDAGKPADKIYAEVVYNGIFNRIIARSGLKWLEVKAADEAKLDGMATPEQEDMLKLVHKEARASCPLEVLEILDRYRQENTLQKPIGWKGKLLRFYRENGWEEARVEEFAERERPEGYWDNPKNYAHYIYREVMGAACKAEGLKRSEYTEISQRMKDQTATMDERVLFLRVRARFLERCSAEVLLILENSDPDSPLH